MDRMPFESPVCIQTGTSTRREVKTVGGAAECLVDWPHGKRGSVYAEAVDACEAALAGRVPVAQARAAFVGFARDMGVLVHC